MGQTDSVDKHGLVPDAVSRNAENPSVRPKHHVRSFSPGFSRFCAILLSVSIHCSHYHRRWRPFPTRAGAFGAPGLRLCQSVRRRRLGIARVRSGGCSLVSLIPHRVVAARVIVDRTLSVIIRRCVLGSSSLSWLRISVRPIIPAHLLVDFGFM